MALTSDRTASRGGAASLSLPEQFGRYRLLTRLAVGGMGEVYLARYGRPGQERLVVIKRLLPTLAADDDFHEAFKAEARIGHLLNHPNIVQTLDAGTVEGQRFIAFEYVHGPSLVKLLARAVTLGRRFSLELAFHISVCLSRAIDYVHRRCDLEGNPLEIVHMDLAPHNVLITEDGYPKLHDFGIARTLARRTRVRPFRGRSAYLAPEQLDGLDVDQRVDLFALGVLMHEMIVGRPLFRAPSDQATATRILHARIPNPRIVRSDCPARLADVVMRALARDRDSRYQTAGEILRDLEACAVLHGIGPSTARMRAEISELAHSVMKLAISQQLTPTVVDPAEFGLQETTQI
ncbi:MAG: protein kinase [Myxococcales bacterium]|nr:protein kinase [Myxococcales bacterium]